MAGSAIRPISTSPAPTMPTMAASTVVARTVDTASDPRIGPVHTWIAENRRSPTPARSRMFAMKMNSGMAARLNSVISLQAWATMR